MPFTSYKNFYICYYLDKNEFLKIKTPKLSDLLDLMFTEDYIHKLLDYDFNKKNLLFYIRTPYEEGSYEVAYDFYIKILPADTVLQENTPYFPTYRSAVDNFIQENSLKLITKSSIPETLYESSRYHRFLANKFRKLYVGYDDEGNFLERQFINQFHMIYSWMEIPDKKHFDEICEIINGRKILEIGAGRALLARLLSDHHSSTEHTWICTDSGEWGYDETFYPVEKMNHTQALVKYSDAQILVLIWPVIGPMAYETITQFKGDKLFFSSELWSDDFEPITEEEGYNSDEERDHDYYISMYGCPQLQTADEQFYDELRLNWKVEKKFDQLILFARR